MGKQGCQKGYSMNNLSVKVGKHIRSLRAARGWSLAHLAELINSNASYVSKIEQGQVNTSLDKIEDIAHAFEIPVFSLFFFEEEKIAHKELVRSTKIQLNRFSEDTLTKYHWLLSIIPGDMEKRQ